MSHQPLTGNHFEPHENAFFPSLQKEMNKLFDQFRTDLPSSSFGIPSLARTAVVPAVDVTETDGAIEISAEVPGTEENDLNVSIAHDVLTLQGQKNADHEVNDDDHYHLIERRYGNFCRRIPLGFVPEAGDVTAGFTNGVLKLRITKPVGNAVGNRKIEITKK